MKLPDEKIEFLRALAESERWESEIAGLLACEIVGLSKETMRQLLDTHEWGVAEHALRVQIEKERVETAWQAARLLEENLRLREALARVQESCDRECAGCGAWYVAEAALKEKP